MNAKENLTKHKIKYNLLILLFCFGIATIFLIFCSQNSFLYKFNSNIDSNWYVTMGRSVASGKVPYKDIFEQKGPLVYFLFAFFTLFKNYSLAVFIFEIICIASFLLFVYKISSRYLSRLNSMVIVAIMGFLVCVSPYNVVSGGTTEEFCLPFITYILLCFLEFFEDKKQFNVAAVNSGDVLD